MRRAAALLLAAIAVAGGDFTVVGDGGERRESDPYATASPQGVDVIGGLFAPGVGFFVETRTAAATLLAGAFARRFSGHVPLAEVLAAGQVFTIRPILSALPDGRRRVEWRLRGDAGELVGAIVVSRRVEGEISRADAELIALETAAAMADDSEVQAALARAGAIAAIDETPNPAPRPGERAGAASPTINRGPAGATASNPP